MQARYFITVGWRSTGLGERHRFAWSFEHRAELKICCRQHPHQHAPPIWLAKVRYIPGPSIPCNEVPCWQYYVNQKLPDPRPVRLLPWGSVNQKLPEIWKLKTLRYIFKETVMTTSPGEATPWFLVPPNPEEEEASVWLRRRNDKWCCLRWSWVFTYSLAAGDAACKIPIGEDSAHYQPVFFI